MLNKSIEPTHELMRIERIERNEDISFIVLIQSGCMLFITMTIYSVFSVEI